MALTDLLEGAGRVVQAAALGLAVYGCGGGEECKGLGSCYDQICPGILPPSQIMEADQYCTKERVQQWQEGDDCLGLHCLTQARFCPTLEIPKGDRDPKVLSCMESYGWVQCTQNNYTICKEFEQCIDNRCK